mmetsp:Transcript_32963/g.59464  ORF Transcript_32963/g.59464 Transcript_32963/m.59464 type:complete len:405 (+) Transcript_32963:66-1280(+)
MCKRNKYPILMFNLSILGVACLHPRFELEEMAIQFGHNSRLEKFYPRVDSYSQDVAWWRPNSFASSFAVACAAPLGWAIAGICAKAATSRGVKHSHYFLDFIISNLLCVFIFFHLAGGMQLGQNDPLNSLNGIWAATAGSIDAVGNLLMTLSIATAGLTTSVTICMALGLIVGAVTTYAVDHRGNLICIGVAVFLSVLAVVANTMAVKWAQDSQESIPSEGSGEECADSKSEAMQENSETRSANAPTTLRYAFVGGIFIGAWAPLSAKSMTGPEALSPYASFLFFSIGFFIAGCVLLQVKKSMEMELDGISSEVSYIDQPQSAHTWGFVAGFAWSLASQANCLGGKSVGFSVAFTVGQSSPMISGLVGLLYFKDFRHSQMAIFLCLFSIILYFSGVLVLANSST